MEHSSFQELQGRIASQDAQADLLAESFDGSTGLSWLWALVFGPIYYLAHGFWKQSILVALLNCIVIGFIVSPFLAYPAWRGRAKEKAEKMLLVERSRF